MAKIKFPTAQKHEPSANACELFEAFLSDIFFPEYPALLYSSDPAEYVRELEIFTSEHSIN